MRLQGYKNTDSISELSGRNLHDCKVQAAFLAFFANEPPPSSWSTSRCSPVDTISIHQGRVRLRQEDQRPLLMYRYAEGKKDLNDSFIRLVK